MKRKYGNHIASYYGPTFLFVVLSWLSFAVPVQQVSTPKLVQFVAGKGIKVKNFNVD
jgi:hypothetical protein